MHERKVELRKQLATFLGQLNADRLDILKASDLVTAVAAVTPDGPTSEIVLLLFSAHPSDSALGFLERHDGTHVV